MTIERLYNVICDGCEDLFDSAFDSMTEAEDVIVRHHGWKVIVNGSGRRDHLCSVCTEVRDDP